MATENKLDFEKELEGITPLIRKISANFINSKITAEELFQEGTLGVYEAFKRYDPEEGVKFSTYAYFWIKKYIMKYVEIERSEEEFNDQVFQDKNEEKPAEEFSEENNVSFPENMPNQEKQVLHLLFNEEKTLNEISKILNISREKVRQIKEMGLRRMRGHTVDN